MVENQFFFEQMKKIIFDKILYKKKMLFIQLINDNEKLKKKSSRLLKIYNCRKTNIYLNKKKTQRIQGISCNYLEKKN